jgi:hypothetical protein
MLYYSGFTRRIGGKSVVRLYFPRKDVERFEHDDHSSRSHELTPAIRCRRRKYSYRFPAGGTRTWYHHSVGSNIFLMATHIGQADPAASSCRSTEVISSAQHQPDRYSWTRRFHL